MAACQPREESRSWHGTLSKNVEAHTNAMEPTFQRCHELGESAGARQYSAAAVAASASMSGSTTGVMLSAWKRAKAAKSRGRTQLKLG